MACTGNDSSADGKARDKTDARESPSKDSGSSAAETPGGKSVGRTSPLERYVDYKSDVYSDPGAWLCRPDVDDICDAGLDSTRVDADGKLTVQPWHTDPDAPIDCFYVYPTISTDPGKFSDREASPAEEGFVAVNQVARLGQACRVFAPIYRQGTLSALAASLGTGTVGSEAGTGDEKPAEDPDTPFKDVLDAWRTYMANDNAGRGVVLIGHSQGAALLNRLIKSEIDPNADVVKILVSAYLAGWSLKIPNGADVGGDFANIPLCRDESQVHCAVSWSSYRSTVPPVPGSIFGRSSKDETTGVELVSACTNPASIKGGSADAKSYFPSAPDASIVGTLGSDSAEGASWVSPDNGAISTPFVSTPGLVSVECRSRDGFDYLELTVNGDPTDPRIDDIGGDLSPEWGMHLQDVNVVMGNIVDLVARQSRAFIAGR